jgi:hypothetical protein
MDDQVLTHTSVAETITARRWMLLGLNNFSKALEVSFTSRCDDMSTPIDGLLLVSNYHLSGVS